MEDLAGDVAGLVAEQEERCLGNVCGFSRRLRGMPSIRRWRRSSSVVTARVIGVSMSPGATVLTRMLDGANSSAIQRVSIQTPVLETQ